MIKLKPTIESKVRLEVIEKVRGKIDQNLLSLERKAPKRLDLKNHHLEKNKWKVII